MSNLQIKTVLVIFQILLVVISALTYTYILRVRKLNKGRWSSDKHYVSKEKLNRLTMFIYVITVVSFFIVVVVIAL